MKLFCLLLFVMVFPNRIFAGEWERVNAVSGQVRAVAVKDSIIAAGTRQGTISVSSSNGADWEKTAYLGDGVNAIVISSSNVYAAAENGLWASADTGKTWKRFTGNGATGLFSLALLGNTLIAATPKGLFEVSGEGRWKRKAKVPPGGSRKYSLAVSQAAVFAASGEGIFRLEGSGWKPELYAPVESECTESEEGIEPADQEKDVYVHSVIIGKEGGNLVASLGKRVYQRDSGRNEWQLLDPFPAGTDVVSLSADEKWLLAATRSQVYAYDDGNWAQISSPGTVIFAIGRSGNTVIAGGDSGLFFKGPFETVFLGRQPRNEPSIGEVQQAAIIYAEVHPEKIQRWRKEASRKAWLPEVNIDLERDVSELWHWESGSTTKNDDDSLRRGKEELDWGLRLSWDLGDIIWNDDQASIDVRSRLMVELRRDILDEVNSLYFERLRKSAELENMAHGDTPKRREKELRLAELQARLDALTGGFYGRCLAAAEASVPKNSLQTDVN